METRACHEHKPQNEVKSDLKVFLSGFVRFAYLDFYKWRCFFHLNLMGAEALGKVSWPIAGEHNCTNWHLSFYNDYKMYIWVYCGATDKGLLWKVGLTYIHLQFAFEGQYNSIIAFLVLIISMCLWQHTIQNLGMMDYCILGS